MPASTANTLRTNAGEFVFFLRGGCDQRRAEKRQSCALDTPQAVVRPDRFTAAAT